MGGCEEGLCEVSIAQLRGGAGLSRGQRAPALPLFHCPPVPGAWAAWSAWSSCDAECGGGMRSRIRSCTDPPPKNGGQPCVGEALQSQSCNLQPCGATRGTAAGTLGWGHEGVGVMGWGHGAVGTLVAPG